MLYCLWDKSSLTQEGIGAVNSYLFSIFLREGLLWRIPCFLKR